MKFDAITALSSALLLSTAQGTIQLVDAVAFPNANAQNSASAIPSDHVVNDLTELASLQALYRRATPQAPKGYAPSDVNCPSDRPSIRSASSLSSQEQSWLEKRRNNTVPAMRDLLRRLNIQGLDVNQYLDRASRNISALPNIGITFSGGGWRAMLNGAGVLSAFDDRTTNSTSSGHIGGVLQAATYIVGVSGGNWLTGSIMTNNFTSVEAIQNADRDQSGSLWDFSNSLIEGKSNCFSADIDLANKISRS